MAFKKIQKYLNKKTQNKPAWVPTPAIHPVGPVISGGANTAANFGTGGSTYTVIGGGGGAGWAGGGSGWAGGGSGYMSFQGGGGGGGSSWSNWTGNISGTDIGVAINCAPRPIRIAIQGKMNKDYKYHYADIREWMKILMQHLEPMQAYKIMLIHEARASRE